MTRGSQPITIRPPRKEEWPAACELLARIWPPERWLWQGSSAGAIKLPHWRSICAFVGNQVVGHIARLDFSVSLSGTPAAVAGIASVATDPAHRRKGIANRLLAAILKTADAEQLPAVLFTGLPAVYLPHGFSTVPQEYIAIPVNPLPADAAPYTPQPCDTISQDQLAAIAHIYQHLCPDYHGKILRDPDYWTWYARIFNHDPRQRIILSLNGERITGYLRLMDHTAELILTEFSCSPADPAASAALLAILRRAAVHHGHQHIILALPPSHPFYSLLNSHHIHPAPQPLPHLEHLMLRPANTSAFSLQPSALSPQR